MSTGRAAFLYECRDQAGIRIADRGRPVLQQIEGFGDPTITVNDCFRPVSRWWDRITRPEQILESLPQAMRVLTDPAECGPVTLALPQDVQAEAYDYPEAFFARAAGAFGDPRPIRPSSRCRSRIIARSSAADHCRRRGALRARLRRARRFRGTSRCAGGRDPGRQGRSGLGSSQRHGCDRRCRWHCGQCARCRSGPDPRDRHTAL